MSTAAVTRRAQPAAHRPSKPAVHVVRAPVTPARAPFVIVVLVLLATGLGTLLLLNTLLAQGSFTLHTLNERVANLADREQALQQRASELAAPQRLARRAKSLGMVPSQNPAFLRAEDGKILGEPVPASAPVAPVISTDDGNSAETTEPAQQSNDRTGEKQNDQTSQPQNNERKKQSGGGDTDHASNASNNDGSKQGGNGGGEDQ